MGRNNESRKPVGSQKAGAGAPNQFRATAVEVIFNGHIDAELLLQHFRRSKYGLHSGFIKWHNGEEPESDDDEKGPGPHTHCSLHLRETPRLPMKNREHYKYFSLGHGPDEPADIPYCVEALGKGNGSAVKKMHVYVSYLTDGHDNGQYKDSWNYKYDHELAGCKDDGKILLLLDRGKTFRQIVDEADWNFKAYCMKQADPIAKMINNWKKHNQDLTVRHKLKEFNPELVTNILEDWKPDKESLIIKGPSNKGKTELAKALLKELTGKNPLFCSNLNKLKYRDAHQPFVLDDMNFSQISRSKGISLLDIENERDIRILFGIHTIDAGCPRIFTTNEEMEAFLPFSDDPAIARRFRVIDVTSFGRLY